MTCIALKHYGVFKQAKRSFQLRWVLGCCTGSVFGW